MAWAAVPHPWRAATPSLTSAPLEGWSPRRGSPGPGVLDGVCEGVAVRLGDRPPPALLGRVAPAPLAAGDRGGLSRQRPRVIGGDRNGEGHVQAATRRLPGRYGRGGRLRSVPGGHCPKDRFAQGPGGSRQQAARAAGQADRPPGQPVDRHPPRALEPIGRGGGGDDGRPEPLEREGGDEPQPVDLGLGRSSMPAAAASGRAVPERVPLGSSSRGVVAEVGEADPAPSARGARRGRSRCGPRRTAARWTPPGWPAAGSPPPGRARRRAAEGPATSSWRRPRSRAPSGARHDRLEHERHQPTRRRADAPEAHRAGHLVAQRGHVGVERVELHLDPPGPATTTCPSSVRKPPVRSNSVTPSSRSRRARCDEMFDWTVWSARAAAEKLPPSATAIRAESWRRSIAGADATHREQLFDRLLARAYRGAHKRKHFSPRSALREVRQDPPSGPSQEAERWPSPRAGVSALGSYRSRAHGRHGAAAFFDLDRTLLRGASGPVIGEALKEAGVTDRSIPGEQLIYRFYDLFGENRPSMEVTRRAVRFARGMGARAGAGGRRGGRRGAGRRRAALRPTDPRRAPEGGAPAGARHHHALRPR